MYIYVYMYISGPAQSSIRSKNQKVHLRVGGAASTLCASYRLLEIRPQKVPLRVGGGQHKRCVLNLVMSVCKVEGEREEGKGRRHMVGKNLRRISTGLGGFRHCKRV